MSDQEAHELRDEVARAIEQRIDAEPHSRRLYPDIYALAVADAVLPIVTQREAALTEKLNALVGEVREYRSAICFEQTCLRCASTLDKLASAEAEIERLRGLVSGDNQAQR